MGKIFKYMAGEITGKNAYKRQKEQRKHQEKMAKLQAKQNHNNHHHHNNHGAGYATAAPYGQPSYGAQPGYGTPPYGTPYATQQVTTTTMHQPQQPVGYVQQTTTYPGYPGAMGVQTNPNPYGSMAPPQNPYGMAPNPYGSMAPPQPYGQPYGMAPPTHGYNAIPDPHYSGNMNGAATGYPGQPYPTPY